MSMKELREYRRKNDLCVYCGGERDDEFVNCSFCRIKINARNQRTRNKEKERERNRKRYKKLKKKKLAQMKIWREQNPDYFSNYHKANRKKRLEYNRRWREKNLEAELKRGRIWARENPEDVAIKGFKRRARIAKNGSSLSPDELEQIKAASLGLCPYCGKRIENGHFDHIQPLSAGGRNSIENIIYCCQSCNLSKGNSSLLEFLHKRSKQGVSSLSLSLARHLAFEAGLKALDTRASPDARRGPRGDR